MIDDNENSFYKYAKLKKDNFGTDPTGADVAGHVLAETLKSPLGIFRTIRETIVGLKKVKSESIKNSNGLQELMQKHVPDGHLFLKYMTQQGLNYITSLKQNENKVNAIYSDEFADCAGVAIHHPNGIALLHISPGVMRDGQQNVRTGDLHDQRRVRNSDYAGAIITCLYELITNQSFEGRKPTEEQILAMEQYLQELSDEERKKFLVAVSGHNDEFRQMIEKAIKSGGNLENKDDLKRTMPQLPVLHVTGEKAQWLKTASAICISDTGIVSIRPKKQQAKEIIEF